MLLTCIDFLEIDDQRYKCLTQDKANTYDMLKEWIRLLEGVSLTFFLETVSLISYICMHANCSQREEKRE